MLGKYHEFAKIIMNFGKISLDFQNVHEFSNNVVSFLKPHEFHNNVMNLLKSRQMSENHPDFL